jgi:hypothetical protein
MPSSSDGPLIADSTCARTISEQLDAALDASFPSSDPISATQRHHSQNTPRIVRLVDFNAVPTERPFVLVREEDADGLSGFRLTWWCNGEDTPGHINSLFPTLGAATTAAQAFAKTHKIAVVHVFRSGDVVRPRTPKCHFPPPP